MHLYKPRHGQAQPTELYAAETSGGGFTTTAATLTHHLYDAANTAAGNVRFIDHLGDSSQVPFGPFQSTADYLAYKTPLGNILAILNPVFNNQIVPTILGTDWMTHPGFPDEIAGGTNLSMQRATDYDAFTSNGIFHFEGDATQGVQHVRPFGNVDNILADLQIGLGHNLQALLTVVQTREVGNADGLDDGRVIERGLIVNFSEFFSNGPADPNATDGGLFERFKAAVPALEREMANFQGAPPKFEIKTGDRQFFATDNFDFQTGVQVDLQINANGKFN